MESGHPILMMTVNAPSTPPPPRKNRAWIAILIVLVLGAITAAFEWQYSSHMRQHIQAVNHDLANRSYSTGLIGALSELTRQADVSREIMETKEHVHTAKDWYLAHKINRAIQQSSTVGEAIGRTIAAW